MTKNKILFLSRQDIRELVKMEQAIPAVQEAFARLSAGQALVPERMHLNIPDGCTKLLMPVFLPETGQVGLKLISLCPNNPAQGLPYSQSIMLVVDARTGQPLAVLEAAYLTAIRTGAASGVATDLLARKKAETVAIFGAGLQGRTQLMAVCAVRPIRRAFIFDPDFDKANRFASEMQKLLGIPVERMEDIRPVEQADIICTATPSTQPVFPAEAVKSGTHINAIGAFKPEMQEVPPEIVTRATVVVDHLESCRTEAGDLIKPIQNGQFSWEAVHAEIGEIILGKKPGRTSAKEITFFKSVGNAVQDLAVASLAISRATQKKMGQYFDLLGEDQDGT